MDRDTLGINRGHSFFGPYSAVVDADALLGAESIYHSKQTLPRARTSTAQRAVICRAEKESAAPTSRRSS